MHEDFAKAFDKCDPGVFAQKLKLIEMLGKRGKRIHNLTKGGG